MNQELMDMANKTLELMPPDSHCRELYWSATDEELKAFAALVAAAEREACAKLADEYATWGGSNFFDWFKKLSAAIQARGETK